MSFPSHDLAKWLITSTLLYLLVHIIIFLMNGTVIKIVDSAVVDTDDGPDTPTDYVLRKRGKRHDYFTSCLPWLQKGDAVSLP